MRGLCDTAATPSEPSEPMPRRANRGRQRPSEINKCPWHTDEEREETLRLWHLVRQGDAEAFNDLADHWGGHMVAMAKQFLFGWHDAEDAAQEVWAQLWRRKPEINGEPRAFFYGCARFGATVLKRRFSCRMRGGPDVHVHDEETRREIYNLHTYKHGRLSIDGTEYVPEEDTGFQQLGMMRRLIAGLKPEHRELIEARFCRGELFVNIAARVGINKTTARVRVERIVRELRQQAADEVGWENLGPEPPRSSRGFSRPKRKHSEIDWPKIIAMAESGIAAQEIAQTTGVKLATVLGGIRRHRLQREQKIAA